MDNNLPNDLPTPPSPQPPPQSPPIPPQNPPEHPNSPNQPTDPSNLPPPIQVIHGDGKDQGKDDEPLVDVKVNNPFAKFFNWIKRLIKNEGIKITIKPLTAIAMVVALTGGGGMIGGAIVYFFPHSSPILHRAVVYQGNLQKTGQGLFLTLPNSDLYTLRPKVKSNINFQSLTEGPVLVKGNLTVEKFVIDVTEIIPLGANLASNTSASPNTPNDAPNGASPNIPNQDLLPQLYSGLTWETNQTKILTFTSGKRRIEHEGVYLESSKLTDFPYDFINYYINQLQDGGFKQTLNKIDPDGITSSFEKKGLFFTFGVKNIYSGSGNSKKLVGYKAYIEHN